MRKYGLRRDRLKAIEKSLLNLLNEVRIDLPSFHNISFEASYYPHNKETKVHGYIHYGNTCEIVNNVEALSDRLDKLTAYRKNKVILFQLFSKVLK